MANVNKVILMGNLTRDPELRYTPKGTAVADVGLAINRVFGTDGGERREETTFVDVTLWGRQAELAQQYLCKGRGVYIEGRLQMDTWEDKASGQKRSKLKVVAENLQFLPSSGGSNQGGRPLPPRDEASHSHSDAPSQSNHVDYDEEDDIPF